MSLLTFLTREDCQNLQPTLGHYKLDNAVRLVRAELAALWLAEQKIQYYRVFDAVVRDPQPADCMYLHGATVVMADHVIIKNARRVDIIALGGTIELIRTRPRLLQYVQHWTYNLQRALVETERLAYLLIPIPDQRVTAQLIEYGEIAFVFRHRTASPDPTSKAISAFKLVAYRVLPTLPLQYT